ncbi:MAG: glycosyltransferase [Bacteroidales bacterium]
MKRISITVINDLVTDQRVHRMAGSLVRQGYKVRLTGRKLPGSLPVTDLRFTWVRFRMLFRKGLLFYASYNIRLFLSLLFCKRPDILIAVDLDTLSANFLAGKLRRIPLIYDSHEYFTEVPELINRPRVKRIWEAIERYIVPKLTHAIAVSESISKAYNDKYGVQFVTIRNVSELRSPELYPGFNDNYTAKYKLIYQGALNLGRGIELMIESLRYMQDTMLFIVGDGDIRQELRQMVHKLQLTDRVMFPGRIPPAKLVGLTAHCNVGLSLEEDRGLNYRLALPNKVFDYIQARIPVLCSDLPEMAALVRKYDIGEVCSSRKPEQLASQLSGMMKNQDAILIWKENLEKTARELCWENEEQKLLGIVENSL